MAQTATARRGRPSDSEQEREDRRRHILKAARQLIATEGAEALTIRNVAAAAGIATGTVYLYFASKEALLIGLMSDYLANAARRLKTGPDGADLAGALAILWQAEAPGTAASLISALGNTAAQTPEMTAVRRQVNGRTIALLQALSRYLAGRPGLDEDTNNMDTILLVAAMIGLGAYERGGMLDLLGYDAGQLTARLADLLTQQS